MKIGYVRVSKQEQHEALQVDALKEAGCEKWFLDKITGSEAGRKGLDEALAYLWPGDTIFTVQVVLYGRHRRVIKKTEKQSVDISPIYCYAYS